MKNYVVLTASRKQVDIFNPTYSFRNTLTEKSSNLNDHQQGALALSIKKDVCRDLFILSKTELNLYNIQLNNLTGEYYVQGDLSAGADLLRLHLEVEEKVHGILPNEEYPKQLRFSYLRDDGTIAGVSLLCKSSGEIYSIAVVNYPEKARSYNEGVVTFFLPEDIATKILSDEGKNIKKLASEREIINELSKQLNNEDIFQLINQIRLNPNFEHDKLLTFYAKLQNTVLDENKEQISFLCVTIEDARKAIMDGDVMQIIRFERYKRKYTGILNDYKVSLLNNKNPEQKELIEIKLSIVNQAMNFLSNIIEESNPVENMQGLIDILTQKDKSNKIALSQNIGYYFMSYLTFFIKKDERVEERILTDIQQDMDELYNCKAMFEIDSDSRMITRKEALLNIIKSTGNEQIKKINDFITENPHAINANDLKKLEPLLYTNGSKKINSKNNEMETHPFIYPWRKKDYYPALLNQEIRSCILEIIASRFDIDLKEECQNNKSFH